MQKTSASGHIDDISHRTNMYVEDISLGTGTYVGIKVMQRTAAFGQVLTFVMKYCRGRTVASGHILYLLYICVTVEDSSLWKGTNTDTYIRVTVEDSSLGTGSPDLILLSRVLSSLKEDTVTRRILLFTIVCTQFFSFKENFFLCLTKTSISKLQERVFNFFACQT